jgi:hypothetical protein
MTRPRLTPRVEQADDLLREGINPTEIRTFVEIASMATPSQICRIVRTTMLLRDNVLDVESARIHGILVEATILASALGSRPHQVSKSS